MPSRTATALPDEAPDVTVTELHVRVALRLYQALSYALRGRALVLYDIFLRVDEREQVAPDLLVAPGLDPGSRTVYRVPPEPVPSVTFEILSPKNRQVRGRRILAAKRELLGRIGVPLHIEVDPDDGVITVWRPHHGSLVRVDVCAAFTDEAIGAVRIEAVEPGVVRVLLPDGHEVLDGGGELARAAEAAARAAEAAARADDAAARAGKATARAAGLEAKLRALGVDPDPTAGD